MEKMTAQEAAEWGKTLDFPTVWAALMETREKFDKIGERFDRVKLLGALAGGIVTQDAKEAAHAAGFYVLELAGEAVVRIPDPPEFKLKKYTLLKQA